MTGELRRSTMQPAETVAAVAAQVQDVRDVLHADAAAAGIDVNRVDAVLDAAVRAYADARVHSFIGVLVERDVRSALHLRPVSASENGYRR